MGGGGDFTELRIQTLTNLNFTTEDNLTRDLLFSTPPKTFSLYCGFIGEKYTQNLTKERPGLRCLLSINSSW